MILFFYNLALLTALVASAPWWLWRMATTQKYRDGLMERLGRVRFRKGQDDQPLIWVHAVSVGEVLAVSRLVGELDTTFPGHQLVISTTTRTGQALARERFGANRVFYCPLDLPWAVRAYLNALKPKLLILAETEFWPNLLSGCFRRSIPIAVVNARISDRSWPRYRRLRWLWKPFLGRLSRVLAQSETDAERLKAIGCVQDRVSVAGNLKFDVHAAEEAEATLQLKTLAADLRLVVAGSTLEGEEAALLEAWSQLLEADPQLAMVLAPRHPERFSIVAALLDQSGFKWIKRSDWKSKTAGAIQPLKPGEIVLLDTIGELASVYSLAALAFVGGSLIPAGGHNPLEPAQFGVPIVMGPHYANFRAITEDLRAHNAICIAEKEKLAKILADLLSDRTAANAMGERAKQVFEHQAGATARCVATLKELLSRSVLKLRNLSLVDPNIANQVRSLHEQRSGIEAIFAFLRKRGISQIESIAILNSVLGIPLGNAKKAMLDSATWRDLNSAFDKEIDNMLEELKSVDEPDRPKQG
jgi:3-deoxy-D-manno-octulosonic-acid transferase